MGIRTDDANGFRTKKAGCTPIILDENGNTLSSGDDIFRGGRRPDGPSSLETDAERVCRSEVSFRHVQVPGNRRRADLGRLRDAPTEEVLQPTSRGSVSPAVAYRSSRRLSESAARLRRSAAPPARCRFASPTSQRSYCTARQASLPQLLFFTATPLLRRN